MIYAFNVSKIKIHILDSIRKHKYLCINCNDELTIRKGKIQSWHYSHQTNNSCSFRPREGCILMLGDNGPKECNSTKNCEKECVYNN